MDNKSKKPTARTERDIRIETLNEVKAACPFDGVYGSLHESIAYKQFMEVIDSLIAKYSTTGGDGHCDCDSCTLVAENKKLQQQIKEYKNAESWRLNPEPPH